VDISIAGGSMARHIISVIKSEALQRSGGSSSVASYQHRRDIIKRKNRLAASPA